MFTGRFECSNEYGKVAWHFPVLQVGSSGHMMFHSSLHLGIHRKLLEDMDRRLGPSVTWCRKVVKGPGMVG